MTRDLETCPKNILFLDGECLFCQRTAKILYGIDRHKQLHFSSLQGQTAATLPDEWRELEDQQGNPTGNLALIEDLASSDEKRWRGADAVFRSLYLVGGIWKAAWVFHHLPYPVKNHLYQLIAKNRHRFSGGKKACELPSEDFSDRFVP